jgi:drug/metabolite transporter (DMT)-like permease
VGKVRAGYGVGLCAALLFGASAPISKALLEDIGPQLLAGLLYLGAFLAVAPFLRGAGARREARLRRSDAPTLVVIIVTGGIAAPVLLMLGLERLSGVAGSLLLNLEGPLTLIVGIVVLHEYLGRRAGTGSLLVFAGSAVIGIQGGGGSLDLPGTLLVVAACLGWAIDNNLTQRLSIRDPFQIVAVKTGVAALVNVSLALARGETIPSWPLLAVALTVGGLAYGISILLDAYALRVLGAAREAAVFATAPFAGALLAVPVLAESWTIADAAAAVTMLGGIVLLVWDRHEHRHVHTALTHDHRHVHDEHHRHEHAVGTDPNEPHSHPHEHEPLVHTHPHVSDVHHRHPH